MPFDFPAAVKIRTEKDIAGIREACRLGRLVLDKAHAAIKPGVTTDEIDRIVSAGFNVGLLDHDGVGPGWFTGSRLCEGLLGHAALRLLPLCCNQLPVGKSARWPPALPQCTLFRPTPQVHEYTIELGAYPSPYNYFNFPKSVCTSINEIICHGIPDRRPLQEGDIVNVDVSVYYKGYHGAGYQGRHGAPLTLRACGHTRPIACGGQPRSSFGAQEGACPAMNAAQHADTHLFVPRRLRLPAGDLNETFVVGEVDERSKELIKVTHDVRTGLGPG